MHIFGNLVHIFRTLVHILGELVHIFAWKLVFQNFETSFNSLLLLLAGINPLSLPLEPLTLSFYLCYLIASESYRCDSNR